MRPDLRGGIGQPLGGRQGRAGGGHPVVPVSPPVEEEPQRPGQLPGVRVEAGRSGVLDGGDQYRVFGGEPVEGPLTVAEAFRGDTGLQRREGEPVPDGVEQPVGDVCAV